MSSRTIEQLLTVGMDLQRAGRLDEAEKHYRQALAQQPDNADALHLLGALCAQGGNHEQGIELIRRAIAQRPRVAGFYANLGHVLISTGRHAEAVEAYRHAVRLKPEDSDAHFYLGAALQEHGQIVAAIEPLERAVALNSKSAPALIKLGKSYHLTDRFEDEEACYRKALALAPNSAEAWANLGNLLLRKNKLEEAIACAKSALAIQPDLAIAFGIWAGALREMGRYDEAIEQYTRAISHRADIAAFYNDLAISLRARRRFDEAIAALDKAAALRPDWPMIWINRTGVLLDQSRNTEAEDSARRALQISPGLLEAHLNLAKSQLNLGRIEEGLAAARRAAEINPASVEAHNLLANLLKEDGQIPAAIAEFDFILQLHPDDAMIHSNKVYSLEFDPDCDSRRLLAEQRLWNRRHAEPLKKFIRPHENDRSPDRPLRVGYVSPFFYEQAESFFVVPLLEAHDRRQFEIHCYSDVAREDRITARLKSGGNIWHSALGWPDEQLAGQIRGDRIDILIDLAMHMAHNRATMLARKPAPVQAAWLAYPGGLGLDAVDYHISDPWIDPPGIDESCYHERVLRLPRTWVCYDPLDNVEPARPREAGPIWFGSINNPCKLNEPLLRRWARVMQAVDGSRFLLQAIGHGQRRRIVDLLASLGISSHRILFAPRMPRIQYLRLYDRIDICLDPLPYNGITTTCDALWMGVPVVSLVGKTAAGRAGRSVLQNVGLSDFVADTEDQFIAIATKLAGDLPRLANLRGTLRQRICGSAIMDAPRFALDIERAYRQMWMNWCLTTSQF